MTAPRREGDDRRSVGSHEKMMAALGRASGGWKKPYGPNSTMILVTRGIV